MNPVPATECIGPRKCLSTGFKITVLTILCVVAGGIVYALRRSDEHYSEERRQWKNSAIAAITNDLKDPDHLKERLGDSSKTVGKWDDTEWLTPDTIACRDGAWLAYRSQTYKVDPKIYDIFVARASDGNWYYSDYHFCIGAMVLMSHGQPVSLDRFRKDYCLTQFDGSSDDALRPTQNHQKAEQSTSADRQPPH